MADTTTTDTTPLKFVESDPMESDPTTSRKTLSSQPALSEDCSTILYSIGIYLAVLSMLGGCILLLWLVIFLFGQAF